jgi:S1-C subfamily serine protease
MVPVVLLGALTLQAQEVDKRVLDAEARRVAVVEKIKPTVVAIFARGGQGGGSGVLIDKDGFALTNFHVVQPAGPVMKCGLADGTLYDAVLVGLDKVGDVALIKLLPDKPGKEFPFAPMGDSDKVKAGDWSIAAGNPFLLATDFTPTVTFGLVSGVQRYQYPAGTLLEYTDCIQIDTSINPGNSGGPLFNLDGEIIGINGRGSFEKRGRVNSGVGYAISINQIKNFMGHMRAGIDTDHASLGATVRDESGEVGTQMIVSGVLEESDVARRGLELGDELLSFGLANRFIPNSNQFKNVLGLYPKGWRVPLTYRRKNERHEVLVRLMGVQPQVIKEGDEKDRPKPGPATKPQPIPPTPAAKLYEPKPGFANFYFNKLERDRLWAGFKKHGDFAPLTGNWTMEVQADTKLKNNITGKVAITEEKEKDGKGTRTVVNLLWGGALDYKLDPLKTGADDIREWENPPGSGGLMMALYQYRRLLTMGAAGFERQFVHGGHEPFYPPPADGAKPKSLRELRVDTEVLRTEHGAVIAKWYFSLKDQSLLGFEVYLDKDKDPCEVYVSEYKQVDGRSLPHRFIVHYGNERYGTVIVKNYQLAAAK